MRGEAMVGGYRGPDRRPALEPAPASRRLLAAAPLLGAGGAGVLGADALGGPAGLTGLGGLSGIAATDGTGGLTALAVAATVVLGVPLVVAAVLLLCAWRVGGLVASARAGVAAALAGGAGPAAAWVAAGVAPPTGAGAAVAAPLLAALAGATWQLAAARRGPAVQADLRPSRELLGAGLLVLAVGAGTAVVAHAVPPLSWAPAVHDPVAAVCLLAVLVVLGGLAGASVAGAAAALRTARRARRLRDLAVVADLRRCRDELAEDRLRRHDARSALAAVRAASDVLTGETPALPGPRSGTDRAFLAAALRDELSRVERLLGGGDSGPTLQPAGQPTSEPGDAPARTLRPGTVDLRAAARPVVAAWRARGLDVTGPATGEPVVALGDDDAVRRILGNLLDNASRHAPGAAVHLHVAGPGTATGGRAALTVTDDGPGVPAHALHAVLQAGARVSGGRVVRVDGGGLGLASAHTLAAADGGSLRLLPTDRGTCVELRLPAAAAAVPASPSSARAGVTA